MPELPEVETIRRVLAPQLTGRMAVSVSVRTPGVIAYPSPAEFIAGTAGKTIKELCRRGKFLIIRMDRGMRIIVHLRMTGCLLITPEGYPEEAHTHVIMKLDDSNELRFSDTRRFGRLWLLDNGKDLLTGMDRLGPEPFRSYRCIISAAKAWEEQKEDKAVPDGPVSNSRNRKHILRRDTLLRRDRSAKGSPYAQPERMAKPCHDDPGTSFLLHREKHDNP